MTEINHHIPTVVVKSAVPNGARPPAEPNGAGHVASVVNAIQEPKREVRIIEPPHGALRNTIADLEKRMTAAAASTREECLKLIKASAPMARDGAFTFELKPNERGAFTVSIGSGSALATPNIVYTVNSSSQNPDFIPPMCCLSDISASGFVFIAYNMNSSAITTTVTYEVRTK